jgi:hypothetical protein
LIQLACLAVEQPSSPYLIPDLRPRTSGVDFLNLRQVNLDAMDYCFPSVNNVTLHVRPYSLMCWAHWRIVEELERRGASEVLPSQVRCFREKIESLVVWGAQLQSLSGVPGSSSKRPADAVVPLDFQSWNRSENNTSYLAAVQYGPSLSDLNGLGFLHWEGPVPRVTTPGEKLARAFDDSIRGHAAYDALVDPDLMACDAGFATAVFPLLHPFETTPEEQTIFQERLFPEEHLGRLKLPAGRRVTSISLILALLDGGLSAKDPAAICDGMAFAATPAGHLLTLSPEQEAMSHAWAFLQARQLQRIAMEALLGWVEQVLGSPMKPEALVETAAKQLADLRGWKPESTVASATADCCPVSGSLAEHRAAWLSDLSTFSHGRRAAALAGIVGNTKCEAPELISACMDALLMVAASTAWMTESPVTKPWLAKGGSDRVSLGHWQVTVNRLAEQPLKYLLDLLLKNFIVSQHFAVGTDRYDGERIRLRLILDEQGLDFLRESPWRPAVTRDRLVAVLNLMGSCGMV